MAKKNYQTHLTAVFTGTLLVLAPLAAISLQAVSVADGNEARLTDKVDWRAFLNRHDLVWETLPTQFDYGAFLGNGLLGAMIYRDGENRLRWEMGRADVTEHRRDNNRLPIGGRALETVGKIQDGTMRLDLWNAEVRGTVTTDQDTLQFRTLIAGSKSFDFTPVTARQFRLNILQANEVPTIEEFQLLEANKP